MDCPYWRCGHQWNVEWVTEDGYVLRCYCGAEYAPEDIINDLARIPLLEEALATCYLALRAIWESGDLNDEQVEAYREVFPGEVLDPLPLYEQGA